MLTLFSVVSGKSTDTAKQRKLRHKPRPSFRSGQYVRQLGQASRGGGRRLFFVRFDGFRKAETQKFIEIFASYYTPSIIVIAALLVLVPTLVFGAAFNTGSRICADSNTSQARRSILNSNAGSRIY